MGRRRDPKLKGFSIGDFEILGGGTKGRRMWSKKIIIGFHFIIKINYSNDISALKYLFIIQESSRVS